MMSTNRAHERIILRKAGEDDQLSSWLSSNLISPVNHLEILILISIDHMFSLHAGSCMPPDETVSEMCVYMPKRARTFRVTCLVELHSFGTDIQ